MLNVKKLLVKMLTTEIVKVKDFTTPSRSWAAGGTFVSSLGWAPQPDPGYKIVGVVGCSAMNNSTLLCNLRYSTDGKIYGYVRNIADSSLTDTINIKLLQVKLGGGTN